MEVDFEPRGEFSERRIFLTVMRVFRSGHMRNLLREDETIPVGTMGELLSKSPSPRKAALRAIAGSVMLMSSMEEMFSDDKLALAQETMLGRNTPGVCEQ